MSPRNKDGDSMTPRSYVGIPTDVAQRLDPVISRIVHSGEVRPRAGPLVGDDLGDPTNGGESAL